MMDFFQNHFGGRRIDVFQAQYRVFTGVYIDKNIDEGGKIILPQSALDALSRMHVVYPMLFKIENSSTQVYTHCGVLEFSGEEGCVYIPFWMLDYLGVSTGQLVTVTSATLPKGTYVKIRPQSKAFLEISDPRAVLEKKLRNFSCLTKNDTIIIDHNNKQYSIDIMEVAARSVNGPVEAVSIVETDVEVDFDRPVDMPLSPVFVPPPSQMFPSPIIGGSSSNSANAGNSKQASAANATDKQSELPPEPPKFIAFTGAGRRLDGKSVPTPTPVPAAAAAAATQPSQNSTAKQPQSQQPQQKSPPFGNANSSSGKQVVFGTQQQSSKSSTPASSTSSASSSSSSSSSAAPSSNSSSSSSAKSSTASRPDASKTAPPPTKEESKPEFVPFSGKGRSLRG